MNNNEAVKWLRRASEQGVADAQDLLGDCYYYGCGVEMNHWEAVKWYEKAAKRQCGCAEYVWLLL